MVSNLLIATVMVCATVLAHYLGIVVIVKLLRERPRHRLPPVRLRPAAAVIFVILCLIAAHSVEIWIYAALYYLVGASATFETALYFSTVTFTTLGYGDVILDERWRLIAAIQAANGIILFGWSTAFLAVVIGKLNIVKEDWL